MIDDSERREVARRLRETGEELESAALLWYHIAKALGVRTATDGKTACGMLADLIEPGHKPDAEYEAWYNGLSHYGSTQGEPSTISEVLRLSGGCDRAALMELADDLDRMGDGSMYDASISDEYGIARRIREACGEVAE